MTLTLSRPVQNRLDQLAVLTGAVDRADVINKALAAYDYIVTERQGGAEFFFRTGPDLEQVFRLEVY